jgi:DNA-binding response OmpR family regulator
LRGGTRNLSGRRIARGLGGAKTAEQTKGEAMKPSCDSQINILAIDDHPEVLSEIARILHRVGYGCQRATDMESAARAVEEARPDLIVADVTLSGHSGAAFCEELKRRYDLEEVPVMFLSAMQTPDIIRRGDAGGGTYYLRKPFDAPVFVELVEKTRRAPKPHMAVV